MMTTELFTINGKGIYVPDAPVTVTLTDIEGESARDRSGLLHRTVLRRVRAWEFSYGQLTEDQRAYLVQLLSAGTFQWKYPDGEGLGFCRGWSADYYDAAARLWRNFRFRVEEV